jgi:hypothetical protein
MPEVNFNYAALYYLNQWLSKDRRFCAALEKLDQPGQLETLKEAAVFYRIARNIRKKDKKDKTADHYRPLLEILLRHTSVPQDDPGLIAELNSIEEKIFKEYKSTKRLISFTSKLMWLRLKRPIVIYDSRARKALGTPESNLTAYYAKWRSEFSRHRSEIAKACASLGKVRQYSVDPAAATDPFLKTTADSQWFHERVFDAYLWHKGG